MTDLLVLGLLGIVLVILACVLYGPRGDDWDDHA